MTFRDNFMPTLPTKPTQLRPEWVVTYTRKGGTIKSGVTQSPNQVTKLIISEGGVIHAIIPLPSDSKWL